MSETESTTPEAPKKKRRAPQPIRNSIFGGMESPEIKQLNRTVARPIPMWSYIYTTVNEHTGRQARIPCASMLAIVSSYDTVLSIQDAVVPVDIVDKNQKLIKSQRHYRYVQGRPKPHLTDVRSPLAFLNHEYLHRVLYQHDAQARSILQKKYLPEELQDCVAGFRLIRCYRDKHRFPDGDYSGMMVQRWKVFKIDENCVMPPRDENDTKPPMIDPDNALDLEYELQCPPVFEMMPRGFSNQLMKDLAKFLGAREPFLAETTTAAKYKLWRAAESVEQFNVMFQQEEAERREAIMAAGENISAMPIRQAVRKVGQKMKRDFTEPKSKPTPVRERREENASIRKTGGFGQADFPREPGYRISTPILEEDEVVDTPFENHPTPDYGFGQVGMPVVEQDAVLKTAIEEEDDDEPQSPFGAWD